MSLNVLYGLLAAVVIAAAFVAAIRTLWRRGSLAAVITWSILTGLLLAGITALDGRVLAPLAADAPGVALALVSLMRLVLVLLAAYVTVVASLANVIAAGPRRRAAESAAGAAIAAPRKAPPARGASRQPGTHPAGATCGWCFQEIGSRPATRCPRGHLDHTDCRAQHGRCSHCASVG